ncbi:MAG: hypothetical protein PHC51_07650 [bacterium]|nr:hypothetical protein [bacterium]
MSANNISQIALRLTEIVRVRQNGLRSVNVERDISSQSVIEGYVLTAQARACFARILSGLQGGNQTRAWTLTGPYGSGKSYFGLFLMNLLCRAQSSHIFSLDLFNQVDPLLAQQAIDAAETINSQGFFPIPITGYRAPLQECLKHGLEQALHAISNQPGIQSVLDELAGWSVKTESRSIIHTVEKFISLAPELNFKGVLLVFDELGKSLEYSATNSEQADVFLLQELAEMANRSGDIPFLFIGILHQAFERYATLLDSTTQREWAKVQGRFEDIPFQEPPNQQMWLLVNALETDQSIMEEITPILRKDAEKAAKVGWCPPVMRDDEFISLGERAYPLHPTVMAALPYLFRRLAQNERSIFAYLASHEPHGFQEFLRTHQPTQLIRLPNLFDYLSANFQARLYASGRTRTITETLERLNNANGLTSLEVDLLKTIGMLNWLGEVSPLQAKRASLISALESRNVSSDAIDLALNTLQSRSQIVYRRFNQTYVIWQGSDVDIEERLQEAERQISGAFSLAEDLKRYLSPQPIVARRHSYQTGSMRFFQVHYVDSFTKDDLDLQSNKRADGIVLLCLPTSSTEHASFVEWAQSSRYAGRPDFVIGIIERTGRLHELLHELRCLHWVKQNTPDLRDDSVARRELQTRISAIEILAQNEIERTFSMHRLAASTTGRWFYRGSEITPDAHHGLTHLLSSICDDLYRHTPRLWNELINRRALSSQGAAARRNLIERMLQNADQENLGIEKFPPERSMYDSILKAGGLHRQRRDGKWEISQVTSEDPINLSPTWQSISEYIFSDKPEPRSVDGLYKILSGPPYGLTEGVLPVFLCAFLIVHHGETTLYQEGTLLPEPTVANWELLLRRPDLFMVAGCKVTGTRMAIVERFARGYKVEPMVMPVVRTLIRGITSLPEHTNRTNRLSKYALAVRTAVVQARSPEQLLFVDLPTAVDLQPFEHRRLNTEQVDIFFERLNQTLAELANEMPRLLAWGRDELLTACGFDAGEDGWSSFRTLANDLITRTTNSGLLPLLKRASETADSLAALESVLAYIANRPPRNWTDSDTDRYSEQVQVLGNLFQAARQGYLAGTDLTPAQHKRSQEVAEDVWQYLKHQYDDDPEVLKAALQIMIQRYQSKNDQ